MAQEAIPHGRREMFQQLRVTRLRQMNEIAPFEVLLRGDDREIRTFEMQIDDDNRQGGIKPWPRYRIARRRPGRRCRRAAA